MNWNKGFSSRYYANKVDPRTWRDLERIEITGGSVSRSEGGLQESADISCTTFDENSEVWVRIYLDARQAGSAVHIPIFTGLAATPEIQFNGNMAEYPIQCYSVLQPADDVLLQRGWYAPAEANGATLIRELLKATPAPVTVEGIAPNLRAAIIAEDGETNLTMTNKILEAINWRLQILGNGEIVLLPKPLEISASFDEIENDSIEPQVNKKRDWFMCPNVLRATVDDLTAIARDDSESSPLSTVNRGREVWAEDTSATLNTGEGIAEYARRKLKEAQSVGLSVSYDRRYRPNVLVGDLIRLHYPRQKIDGTFKIISQTIDLSYGATTSEEVIEA